MLILAAYVEPLGGGYTYSSSLQASMLQCSYFIHRLDLSCCNYSLSYKLETSLLTHHCVKIVIIVWMLSFRQHISNTFLLMTWSFNVEIV